MITLVYKTDKTYGGIDYIEYRTDTRKFKRGNTRGHRGHYKLASYTELEMSIEVTTLKQLKSVENQLVGNGYTYDTEWES